MASKTQVKAIAVGLYGRLRQPGEVFDVDYGKGTKDIIEKSTWMELVKSTPVAEEPKPEEPAAS